MLSESISLNSSGRYSPARRPSLVLYIVRMSSQILCALYNPAPYAHSSRVGYSIRRHTKGGSARPVSAARKPIVVPKRRRYNQQSFSSCAGMHTQNFPSPQLSTARFRATEDTVRLYSAEPARRARLLRSSHFRFPGRVSKCGAIVVVSLPPAIMVLRILLR